MAVFPYFLHWVQKAIKWRADNGKKTKVVLLIKGKHLAKQAFEPF